MTMDTPGLNYFVIAAKGEQWLAGFQMREWAEQWRDSHCRTGLVLTQPEWLTIQTEAWRAEESKRLMEPRVNGGIHFDGCLATYGGQCTCQPQQSEQTEKEGK